MTDGNISMEEDTELRDLVVQTLENNGVLAKVRAELRASVFLALEEQESVMNPEPLLNKTVKQYLANSEGKLLFSLVREFLEYFGLDCTISVYDPETYFGKEYSYCGRHKLCEELGITSTEPLLGEILKSSMNGALRNAQKNALNNSDRNDTSAMDVGNVTYEVSIPKTAHVHSVQTSPNSSDVSDRKLENISEKLPLNAIDTAAIGEERGSNVEVDTTTTLLTCSQDVDSVPEEQSPIADQVCRSSTISEVDVAKSDRNMSTKSDKSVIFGDYGRVAEANGDRDASRQNNVNRMELRMVNNVENKRQTNLGGKTIYFEEIIVDGEKRCVDAIRKTEPFLTSMSDALDNQMNNGIFNDFPPLNGKRAVEQSDLKELMHVGLVTDDIDNNYEDDFASSASGSTNEQSPSKDGAEKLEKSSPREICMELRNCVPNDRDEGVSEEMEETDETVGGSTCVSINIAITE